MDGGEHGVGANPSARGLSRLSAGFASTDLTPSRASSLPQGNAVNCGSELARDDVLTGDISLLPNFSSTKSKTLFALFVYKSIINFVRVPDQAVNKFASTSKGRCHPHGSGPGNNNKTLEEYSLWKAANPKPRRWNSRRRYAMAGWSASSNSACMAPR
ncbi:hypothetical protein CUN63_02045 [Pseudomonas sp. ACM7]|nr:hypothetical protein CUN63_02045 [Pseudomonas sp. ACM7]